MMDRASGAAAALQAAVDAMPNGATPRSPLIAPQWPTMGRFVIGKWISDFGRLIQRAARSVEAARDQGATDDGRDSFELCLWSLDAARERLLAAACLTLGVPHLTIVGRSPHFRADPKLLAARLQELGRDHPVAVEVNDLGKQAAEHVGVDHRNELSHGISQVPEVSELCWFDLVDVHDGAEVSVMSHTLYANDHFAVRGDISRQAVWENALEDAEGAVDIVLQEAAKLGELIAVAGRLEPPTIVLRDVDSRGISLV